jgi:uncharacterized protein
MLLASFFSTQRRLLYYPTHTYVPPEAVHANSALREMAATTQDGIALKGWYAPATSKSCTIVFFHGNADSLATAAPIAGPYIDAGYGFLLTEYRGYSGLPGSPTETGLYEDGRAFLHELNRCGVAGPQIVLFGHSLGTGIAVQLASERRVGGLMLLAPYLSIPKVAQVHFPFVPAALLARDRFDSERKISSVHTPLLVANGSADQVIPPPQGVQLFTLANEPKEFHSLDGVGHNDAFDAFVPLSLKWLETVCQAR